MITLRKLLKKKKSIFNMNILSKKPVFFHNIAKKIYIRNTEISLKRTSFTLAKSLYFPQILLLNTP